jgi:hypothetical protein
MSAPATRVSRGWLALREPADAAARDFTLVERIIRQPPATRRWLIHDLGCGTGAMGRWLAPLLSGSQHWVLHDRDADLLKVAATRFASSAADGGDVSVEARRSDITGLHSVDLAGATLITASALLDVLTGDELTRLIGVCSGVGSPLHLTLSVLGRVELAPVDALDRRFAAAFDAHQRRVTERGRLLGPDAVPLVVEELARRRFEVVVRPSPWRLTAAQADLLTEWLTGWVGAACEQEVSLAAEADSYTRRRLAQAAAGELAVTVDHADLLACPAQSSERRGRARPNAPSW